MSAATTLPVPESPVIRVLPIETIVESSTNPRKTFTGLEELAADIKIRGLLQPIVVRPLMSGAAHELVFGARRFRASKLAGAAHIFAIVREMNDAEVLESQIVENAQRVDVSALEEAEAYERLRSEFGYSVEQIAEKLTKKLAHVYARLKLNALGAEGRKALEKGDINASTALLIARVPTALQSKALEDVLPYSEGGDPLSAREAARRIQGSFMLTLGQAPFDTADAELVPKAGACSTCPKRTGNAPELFADVSSKDMCTDPDCFAEKKDAGWVKLRTKAQAEGQKVLSDKEAASVFKYGAVAPRSGYVDLKASFYDHETQRSRTYAALLGKTAPVPVLARDDQGVVRQLVPEKDVKKLLAEKGVKTRPTAGDSRPKTKTDASAKLRADANRGAARAAIGKIVAKVEKSEPTPRFWELLVEQELSHGNPIDDLFVRRGLAAPDASAKDLHRAEEALKEAIAKMNGAQLRALFVELVLVEYAEWWRPDTPEGGTRDLFGRFCEAYKVDPKQLVADELAALTRAASTAEAKPAIAPIPSAKAAPPAPKKTPTKAKPSKAKAKPAKKGKR